MFAGKSDPTTLESKVKKDKNKHTTKALVAEKVNTTPKLLTAAVTLKEERVRECRSKGAKPTLTVSQLLAKKGIKS